MEDNREDQKKASRIAFESLEILVQKWIDGSLTEIIDDWKWIFSYSKKYKWAIAFYSIMGIVNTTLGLLSTLMSKYLVDVVTGYQTDKLWVLITVAVSSTLFSLTIGNWLGRFNLKLSTDIANDIQADIYVLELKPGDLLLMCSDGLSNMLEDEEMRMIIKRQRDIVEMAEKLVEAANENGGKDNISVILIDPFADEVNYD